MLIYIYKDNQQFGPFEVQQVLTSLESGYFSYNDFAWHDGCSDWVHLSDLFKIDPGTVADTQMPTQQVLASGASLPNPSLAQMEIYCKLGNIVETSFSKILPKSSIPCSGDKGISNNQGEVGLLLRANDFAESCCRQFASTLRLHSLLPEVRATPTTVLAQEIRSNCFARTDEILVHALASLQTDKKVIFERLTSGYVSNKGLFDTALKGAALGQLAGGLGRTGALLGAYSAIGSVFSELQDRLERKHDELNTQFRSLTADVELRVKAAVILSRKMEEYARNIKQLVEDVIDYGCARCFGDQIDFVLQSNEVKRVIKAIESDLLKIVSETKAHRSFSEKAENILGNLH